ncbi:hypothetical protein, partial [Fournierella sp.]|uniref:hypothetical protein n=1 Tax=Allofournierella sp. TaxID=1940256 RepID=UPI0025BE654E
FQVGLNRLVVKGFLLGLNDTILLRFNVRHSYHLLVTHNSAIYNITFERVLQAFFHTFFGEFFEIRRPTLKKDPPRA